MIDVAQYVVPHRESFTQVSSSNTGPDNREVGAGWTGQSYLMVSIMIRSYIMMMILGRLLRMNISAIMMRTRDSRCSLALIDYLSFLFNFYFITDLNLIILFFSFLKESL